MNKKQKTLFQQIPAQAQKILKELFGRELSGLFETKEQITLLAEVALSPDV